MDSSRILPIASPLASLPLAGGKGANLAKLTAAGFPVPGGFIVTTAAYAAFTAANNLPAQLAQVLTNLDAGDPAALERASADIRGRFAGAALPAELAGEIAAAYRDRFGAAGAVAVRSSATAEDLPNLSFAGQQDTYLNVSGVDALLKAVVACWSSLWTGRAIGYRARNGIRHEDVSLAVVVQAMAPADAAGVLFTANPLTGLRAETVIDATLGLGEALVSGQVEPDHYVVDADAGRITEKRLGAKGGEDQRAVQALPDAAILELAALGGRVQAAFGGPQDIEWTWGEGRLALVQSRPITSLFPVPDGLSAAELRVLASFGAFQGVLGPFTPLGQDAIRLLVAAGASFFGYDLTYDAQRVLLVSGERLWVDLTGALRNGAGRKLVVGALGQVEPAIRAAVMPLLSDPRLSARSERLSPNAVYRMARAFLPMLPRLARSLTSPDAARRGAQSGIERGLAEFEARAAAARTLSDRLDLLAAMARLLPERGFPLLGPTFPPGMAMLYQLLRVAGELPGGRELALEVTRGLPHNVTTEMDLALWHTARRIQTDPAALAAVSEEPSAELAAAFLRGALPPAAQAAVGEFMARYGMRGLREIDFGRPRWREDPTPVIEAVKSYVGITDPAHAPDAVFARGAEAAGAAIKRLSSELRNIPRGRIKAAFARWAARRVRALAGLRETPKFTIIRVMGQVRAPLLDSGRELTAAGLLERPEDLFFLHLDELRRLASLPLDHVPAGLRAETLALVAERRRADEREARRRQVPRVLLSDGRAFYEGMGQAAGDAERADMFTGSPVSPGVAEGRVNVVLDPAAAQMRPGDALVCHGTDPSWTPLFLVAGALVMEVGGMMTHGSVVAREYGIPAVVGVHHATTRLRTGQRVRVDGTNGRVTILDEVGD